FSFRNLLFYSQSGTALMSASIRALNLGLVLDWYFGMFTTHTTVVSTVVVYFDSLSVKAVIVEMDLLLEFFVTLSEKGSVHGGSRLRVREET
ncbi:MAG: hypothetical protein NTW99_05035, partial [Chloroflexi bacterium]|nr:hypothetical protein [Chloroflexota bacterium]